MNKGFRIAAWTLGGLIILGCLLVVATLVNQKILNNSQSDICKNVYGTTHTVAITNDKLSETHVNAKLCDRLIITNNDRKTREIAFGAHERHTEYDGISEKFLNQGQSLQVQLINVGTYLFHDHLEDSVHGDFTVTN